MAKSTTPALAEPQGTIYDDPRELAQQRPPLQVAEQSFKSVGRVITAQNIAKPRSEPAVLQRLKASAAAAGDRYFYMLPFKSSDGKTNVMGPSIKLCSDAARMWGNCEVDCQFVEETPTHFVFNGTFIDHETGYVLHRPYLQRKDQNVGMKDKGRALDQIFQIAASKATRNVIHRAIPEVVEAAYQVAVQSLADKVGKKADEYREKIASFLAEREIPIERIQRIYGKTLPKMDNHDLARLAAQCTSVVDNMISADECWPPQADEIDDAPKTVEKPKPKPEEDAKNKQAAAQVEAVAADAKKKTDAKKKAAAKKAAAEKAAAEAEEAEEEEENDDAASETEEESAEEEENTEAGDGENDEGGEDNEPDEDDDELKFD